MKLKDGSEQIRIKKELAEKIRNECEELDLSFSETLYYILHIYFNLVKRLNIQVGIPLKAVQSSSIEEKFLVDQDSKDKLDAEANVDLSDDSQIFGEDAKYGISLDDL